MSLYEDPYERFFKSLKEAGINNLGKKPFSYYLNELAVRTRRSYLEGVFASPWSYSTLGVGKTVYCLKVATAVYGDWDIAKQHIVFLPQDFLNIFDRAVKEGRPIRLIIWDDAGIWIGRMRWLDKYVKTIREFLNAIRTHCYHIMFTAPSYHELVRGIREQLNLYTFISLKSENPPRSRAVYVFRSVLDQYLGKKIPNYIHIYIFNRYFEYYPEYEEMRRKYVEIGLTRMKIALEEIVKEVKGLTNYINDTYRELEIGNIEDDEEDILELYRDKVL